MEIRKNGVPVDPYGWEGGCRDPYTRASNLNLWTNSGVNWQFSTTGNAQGWTPLNLECSSVHDGAMWLDLGASDPYIQSLPMVNVNAADFNSIEIRMISAAPDGAASIYWTTENSANWGEDKRLNFTVTNDGQWRVYTVRMSDHSMWTGRITAIRIDPANSGRAGTTSDTVALDYIRLTNSAATSGIKANITSPASGSTLGSSSVTFSWAGGTGVSQYFLDLGNTPGGNEIYSQSQGTNRSATVSGIPTDGRTIFVRLWSQLSSGWQYSDHTYRAATIVGGVKSVISSPIPGSTLPSSSVMFSWSSGTGVSQYFLYVGNTAGGNEIYGQSLGTNRSVTVPGIPTDGRTIFVRLWSLLSSGWQFTDYTYRAASPVSSVKAALSSPTPGSTFASSSVTFSWTSGTGASQYFLYVGNTAGGNEIYGQSLGTNRSVTVPGIPTDGRTIYVRLWSLLSTGWQYTDYVYRARF
jgi:hypothetical protein